MEGKPKGYLGAYDPKLNCSYTADKEKGGPVCYVYKNRGHYCKRHYKSKGKLCSIEMSLEETEPEAGNS